MFLSAVMLALLSVPADSTQVVQRLRAITALATQEYSIGVVDGRVVMPAEVDEARLFLSEARRTAIQLPEPEAQQTAAALDSLLGMVARTAPADSVALYGQALMQRLATRLGVALDETPPANPSLVTGARVYAARCAACHGATGMGDGRAGHGLNPAPTNLTDAKLLADATLLDFYRRVTIGVAGTAMPAFEQQLTADERWAVAAYAGTFRTHPAGADSTMAIAATFGTVRRQLDDGSWFDAYMTFEQVERDVRTRNAGLAARIESGFASLRGRTSAPGEGDPQLAALMADLAAAERTLKVQPSTLNLVTQSFVLLVREGLEAILVVGAILAFLAKTGATHRRREVHLGVLAALGASLLTAWALERFFRASPMSREGLEGGVMLVAAGMLFYVSFWLLSKLEVAKWNGFVRSRVSEALSSGSSLALASVAFLAVYREGFETVLFYKALLIDGSNAVPPVLAGMVAGAIVLGVIYVLINRFGVRLPLKPFFAVTSAFLYYMAFVFAGQGIAELQEGRAVSLTPVGWMPAVPQLGIYPTLESLLVQLLLVTALVAGLVWTFVIEPRRLVVRPQS